MNRPEAGKKIPIIHLISGLKGGGAERMVLALCVGSRTRGLRPVVVVLSQAGELLPEFERAGLEVHVLNLRPLRQMNLPDGWKAWRRLKQIVRRYDPEGAILHAHMFHACLAACALHAWRSHIPVVFTLHSRHVKQAYRRFLLFSTRALRTVDVCFPGATPHWYHKPRPAMIPNGIDTRDWQAGFPREEVFTCLFVGRLEPEKNPLMLVDLFTALKDSGRFRIRIAGSGSLQEELVRRIDARQARPFFELTGFREDVRPLMGSAHCLLLPSMWEGMPLVLLEAGAMGLPVIAAKFPGIDAMLNEDNAYLGTTEDFPSLVKQVMNDYGAATRRAARWRQDVQTKFSLEAVCDKHASLYLGLKRSLP